MFRASSVHHKEPFVQAVFTDLVCGTTVRTTRHVQPLLRNGWTCRHILQDDTRSLQCLESKFSSPVCKFTMIS